MNNKIRINFYYFLQQYIYSNDGVFKKYFSGRLNQSDTIGKEIFLTSFISFDFHRNIILMTIIISFLFTFIFKGNILIILQSILAACIFDYISNVMMREYQKNILSYEIAHTLLKIDKRVQSIKLQIGVPERYSIDYSNLPDMKTIDFASQRANKTIGYDNNELRELSKKERELNRNMTKWEYILFLHTHNIKDLNSLLNAKNIEICSNLYKALLCANSYTDVVHASDINEFVGGFITNFDRISFWGRMELGIYTPQILNMGTKFRKKNICEYIIFSSIVLYEKPLTKITPKKLNYKSIINNILLFVENLLLIMSIFFLIKNSDFLLIEGMPEFMNQLFLKPENYLFNTGIAIGILLIYSLKKLHSFFPK